MRAKYIDNDNLLDVREEDIDKDNLLDVSEEDIDKDKVFDVRDMKHEYIQKLIKKYHEQTNQPIPLLAQLTKDLFYKYKHEPQQGQEVAWKCWITSSSGITICARDRKKKGAMLKTARKALYQLYCIDYSPSS